MRTRLEDCFLIVCRGLPDCDDCWLVPISELKNVMKMTGVKSFKELADSYLCDDCRKKMCETLASLEAMQQLKLPETA